MMRSCSVYEMLTAFANFLREILPYGLFCPKLGILILAKRFATLCPMKLLKAHPVVLVLQLLDPELHRQLCRPLGTPWGSPLPRVP